MTRTPLNLLGAAALLLAALPLGAASAQSLEPRPEPRLAGSAAARSPSARLHALFAASDAASLRRNPMSAMSRGDYSHADQLGDLFSDGSIAEERAAAQSDLAALRRINRAALNSTDRLSYDVFRWQRELDLSGMQPDLLALTIVRPANHFYGFPNYYPTFASGNSVAPFRNTRDYDNNLARHRQFPAITDRIIARFRQGMASGVVETKLTVRNMIEQIDNVLRDGVEAATFYAPVKTFPDGVPQADRERLRTAHAVAIRDEVFPAYRRLRDFLATEYLPRARDQVGLSAMPGGARLYRRLILENTTLAMEPEAVHQLGLREVARIRIEMERAKAATGFTGALPQFFEYLRTDRRFTPASREALRDAFYAIGRRVDERVGRIFTRRPRAPLEIRAVEAYRERTEASGSYMDGSPDGARPGVFYFNAFDLPARPNWGEETLYLHEGVPGHHFQIMLAAENTALPNFMRFGGNTAYVEGWALYAESLWDELGMETDPFQRFGGLNDEMLRAMRLVVDTGIHAKGWTREQAIRYMLDNSGMSETETTAEVERYIAIPGQALSYKLGQLKILELRARAEAALGARFNLAAFHDQVLGTGALPLTILEEKLNAWIISQGGRLPRAPARTR